MKITNIKPNSLAAELELSIGDKILKINGRKPTDLIDLSFLLADEEIEMLIEHADGERELIGFEKDIDEEIGAEFESAVDKIKCCKNHCVFCFVDMIASNMRRTLNIKDDDYRLSFLYGNFITLTNLTDADFKRIKNFHLSPLYVSIHAMNGEVRAKMLRTPLAAKIQSDLDKLEKAGAEYHTQVVLCPNLNDGAELDYTISEIMKRYPHAQSLAIVPVGMTKHRRDKFPLTQFDSEGAAKVIAQVEKFQAKARADFGKTFIYLGDEFYFLAGKDMPPAEYYDDFPQIENGIGMTRNFIEEWSVISSQISGESAQQISLTTDHRPPVKSYQWTGKSGQGKKLTPDHRPPTTKIDVVAGTSIASVLKKLAAEIMSINKNLDVRILPVVNEFFGSRINVSGLLTGGDIINALKKNARAVDKILIPATALRSGTETFLDDVTVDDMRAIFPARIVAIHNGEEFFKELN